MCPAPGINRERLPANQGSLLTEKLAANMFNVTVFQVSNKRAREQEGSGFGFRGRFGLVPLLLLDLFDISNHSRGGVME